jgi:glucokinase
LQNIRTILGFDLGGTKCDIGLYDADSWKELHYEQHLTAADRGFSAVLASAIEMINALRRPDTIAVGFGVAGLLRQPEGVLLRSPNIPGASNVKLRAILEEALAIPVYVENDARCFSLAEAILGAGKGRTTVIGVTMGTGVGGGVVIDGNVFRGEHGFAGEIGHMLLRPGEPPYPTDDKRGDMEQFFSGTAMGKRCEAAKKPEEYLEGQACSFLHPDLFREIAWMVTSLTYAFDPSIIVFGGSAGLALQPHLEEIRAETVRWLLPGTPLPELAVAQTKHSGALGAALLTRSATGS